MMLAMLVTAFEVMPELQWRARAQAHRDRVQSLLGGVTPQQAAADRANPITNFLFTYYTFKPSKLDRWSPGDGFALQVSDQQAAKMLARGWQGHDRWTLHGRPSNLDSLRRTRLVLEATARRAPVWNCYNYHEWAMLYKGNARFQQLPLRVSQSVVDTVVQGGARCTHFDAFRFFADDARPLNSKTLTRATQLDHEQPACLHTAMDLFIYACRLSPWIPSELLGDALAVAIQARWLDMRASPYDLAAAFGDHSAFDSSPIKVELAAGRKQFANLQARLAADAAPVRRELARAYAACLDRWDEEDALNRTS